MALQFSTPTERRVLRALQIKQDLMCLKVQGFVVRDTQKYTVADYHKRLLRDLNHRLNRDADEARGVRHVFNRNNVNRAALIVRDGVKSRWYFARASNSPSGDDRRGIKFYLAKWQREHGIRIPK